MISFRKYDITKTTVTIIFTAFFAIFSFGCSEPKLPGTKYVILAHQYLSHFPKCKNHALAIGSIDGINKSTIESAANGNRNDSEHIYLWLLEHGGEHGANTEVICRVIFWEDIAAQQGSINAAYELGHSPDTTDQFRCEQSRKWAKFALEHIEEFRQGYIADADPSLIESQIKMRREQLELTASSICTPSANPPLPIPSGDYVFQHKFTEHPTLESTKVSVFIHGNDVTVVNENPDVIFPNNIVDKGWIMWHEKSAQWIIGQTFADTQIAEVGGCTDGPAVIDLKNRIYWTC